MSRQRRKREQRKLLTNTKLSRFDEFANENLGLGILGRVQVQIIKVMLARLCHNVMMLLRQLSYAIKTQLKAVKIFPGYYIIYHASTLYSHVSQGGAETVTERLTRSQRRNYDPASAYLPPSLDWNYQGKVPSPY